MSSKSLNCPSPYIKDNIDTSVEGYVSHSKLTQVKNPYHLYLKTDAPIGLFDSGVGGLSVFLHLAKLMPNEKYLYYADTKNVPYGSRCKEEIQQLTLTAVSWLVNAGCKIVVIACNSASAYALELARQYYPNLPIVGLVPALKPAVLASQSKHVAVLATQATLAGDLLNRVIQEVAIANNVQVTKWYDPALVPWVEAGMPEESPTANNLRTMLAEFAQQNVDHIVLGCTHYPFFRDFLLTHIQEKNYSIRVVDSGRAIALRVYDLLQKADKLQLPNQQQDTINLALDIWQIRTNMTQLAFYATKRDAKLLNLIIKLAT
ncbi:glutamate racemase [Psychrobacter sp. I-STPA10]|uniref:glutamate racemase n=1 Tax=Psychrobacter sp. I-STPA10 TaxID=2585769 RepID=UPI001E584A6C|nr:glutamate racemase [Psychrobacter sp. I-STPA10]